MPTTVSGLTFFDELIELTVLEDLYQQSNLFNEAAGNTIQLDASGWAGRSKTSTFFQESALVQRRDPSGTGNLTPVVPLNASRKEIKVYRSTPLVFRRQDWVDQNMRTEEGQALFALQLSKQMREDMFNTAVSALLGALLAEGAGVLYDAFALTPAYLTASYLNRGNALLGDMSNNITHYLLHSVAWHNLIHDALNNTTLAFSAGPAAIYNGAPVTLGRSAIVSDSSPLYVPGSASITTDDYYYSMGLKPGAVTLSMLEAAPVITFTQQSGTASAVPANITYLMQAEYEYSISIPGMTYGGADNPTNATLATSGSWTRVAANIKGGPGVLFKTKPA
jgi:hypothetical protein